MKGREISSREPDGRGGGSANAGVFVLTGAGVVLSSAGAICIGRHDEALGGVPLARLVDARDRERIGKLLGSGAGGEIEVEFLGANGDLVPAWLEIRPWQDGSTLRYIAVARVDLTAGDAIPFAKRYAHLFDHSLAGIYLETMDGCLIACNESYAEILGWESREALLDGSRESPFVDLAER